jgi:hypothetical protein
MALKPKCSNDMEEERSQPVGSDAVGSVGCFPAPVRRHGFRSQNSISEPLLCSLACILFRLGLSLLVLFYGC